MAKSVEKTRRGTRAAGLWLVVPAMALLAGCGDACDDAATVCGFDVEAQQQDCSGVTECASLCIVDWDSCNVNDAASPESLCIAECLEASAEGA